MHDPDRWRELGVHWHAYVEVRRPGGVDERSDRQVRLARTPERVFTDPETPIGWIAAMSRTHGHRRRVKLLNPAPRWVETYDEDHLERDFARDLHVLSAGMSLYVDIDRENDRLHLWIEALTTDHCPDGHEQEEPNT